MLLDIRDMPFRLFLPFIAGSILARMRVRYPDPVGIRALAKHSYAYHQQHNCHDNVLTIPMMYRRNEGGKRNGNGNIARDTKRGFCYLCKDTSVPWFPDLRDGYSASHFRAVSTTPYCFRSVSPAFDKVRDGKPAVLLPMAILVLSGCTVGHRSHPSAGSPAPRHPPTGRCRYHPVSHILRKCPRGSHPFASRVCHRVG